MTRSQGHRACKSTAGSHAGVRPVPVAVLNPDSPTSGCGAHAGDGHPRKCSEGDWAPPGTPGAALQDQEGRGPPGTLCPGLLSRLGVPAGPHGCPVPSGMDGNLRGPHTPDAGDTQVGCGIPERRPRLPPLPQSLLPAPPGVLAAAPAGRLLPESARGLGPPCRPRLQCQAFQFRSHRAHTCLPLPLSFPGPSLG